jgi:aminoglycoside phosphotransferase family enzyme/predicted kinase
MTAGPSVPAESVQAVGIQAVGLPPAGEPYAAVTQTHISAVIFVGGLAYKVKKPVRLPFVDLSGRQQRLADCHAEVDLNRRIAPDVYLGVGRLPDPWPQGQRRTGHPAGAGDRAGDGDCGGDRDRDGDSDCGGDRDRDGDGPKAGDSAGAGAGDSAGELPGGEPVVVMRRMPSGRRLSRLIAEGQDVTGALAAIARQVAVMHGHEPPVHGYDLAGTMAALWREGREQLVPFEGDVLDGDEVDEMAGLAAEYLRGRAGMLAARERAGQVRDGHGDLLTDDIFCLDDGPRVLDCLEFDVRLRLGDVLLDVAFLAMDLQAHGRPDLAELFLARYRELTRDDAPRSLVAHYVAYRAFVRAKIECLRHDQGETGAADRARTLSALCRRELRAARVHLVLVGGLPGSGKSTLAASVVADVAGDREWALLSSDAVRKELAGVPATTSCAAPYATGLYDPRHTAATYAELLYRAQSALERGNSVVIDASWTAEEHRQAARRLAASTSVALTEIECRADLDLCGHRLARRTGPHPSDADPRVLQDMSAAAAPWPQAVPIPTEGPKGVAPGLLRQVLDVD